MFFRVLRSEFQVQNDNFLLGSFYLGSFNLVLISDELLRGGVLHLPFRSKPQTAW